MSLFDVLYAHAPFEKTDLLDIISTAPRRYKSYEVRKRRGAGTRTIAQPSPEVKLLQRIVLDHVVDYWPVHDAATAYRRRRSIATHAARHVASRFLLKLDFRDFFPSITSGDLRHHAAARERPELTDADLDVLTKILSWRNKATGRYCLSIGAPSSPSCSNALLFDFDKALSEACAARGVTYSRYADDLAFSTNVPRVLDEIEQIARALVAEMKRPRLIINEAKTINVSKRYRRTIVGLTLSAQGKISIGRERKRQLRAEVHAFLLRKLSAEQIATLRGMLAYVWSVEPTFIDSLVRTYGPEPITLLQLVPPDDKGHMKR